MVSTKAQAVDGFVSGELQAYTNNGYRNFEGNVEVGQDIKNIVRPFVSIQYFADNNSANGDYQHLNAIYKAGLSKQFADLTISGGFIFNQNLQKRTTDDNGYFIKASYAFDTAKK